MATMLTALLNAASASLLLARNDAVRSLYLIKSARIRAAAKTTMAGITTSRWRVSQLFMAEEATSKLGSESPQPTRTPTRYRPTVFAFATWVDLPVVEQFI